jgi:hypothetical protein
LSVAIGTSFLVVSARRRGLGHPQERPPVAFSLDHLRSCVGRAAVKVLVGTPGRNCPVRWLRIASLWPIRRGPPALWLGSPILVAIHAIHASQYWADLIETLGFTFWMPWGCLLHHVSPARATLVHGI